MENAHVPSFAIVGRIGTGKSFYADKIRTSLEKEFGITIYKVPSFSEKYKVHVPEMGQEFSI